MMNPREFRGACIGLTLLFLLTFEFILQRAWVGYLEFDSQKQVSRCLEVKEELERSVCFVEYVESRNAKAEKSVNNYLIVIAFLIIFSAIRVFLIKKRGREENVKYRS